MIERRRWPSPASCWTWMPSSSGPRCVRLASIRPISSERTPCLLTRPQIPHIGWLVERVLPGLLLRRGAPAGGSARAHPRVGLAVLRHEIADREHVEMSDLERADRVLRRAHDRLL